MARFPRSTLDDEYFVLDGHKRVAAARAAGAEFVDADITEIYARPRFLDS
jgi:ParB-like chromosome segregation protein Spo0J